MSELSVQLLIRVMRLLSLLSEDSPLAMEKNPLIY